MRKIEFKPVVHHLFGYLISVHLMKLLVFCCDKKTFDSFPQRKFLFFQSFIQQKYQQIQHSSVKVTEQTSCRHFM